MARKAFDRKIESLQQLRSADSATASAQLPQLLKDRNNYVVSRAAAIVAELKLEELVPDLLAAFDRFFVDPVKSDPQCMAKIALARALRELGHRDAEPYLRGIVHVQLEPAWGGRADTAATLRGTCALALAECYLDDVQILTYLADGLADPEKAMRIDSAVAINQLGRLEGAALLRLKALLGDPDPEVIGHCFASLLSLVPEGSASFISRFLKSSDEDVRLEAASALAQCRDPRAIEFLKEFWQQSLLSHELRRALLINLGASPLVEAARFLVSIVSGDSADLAANAIVALAGSRFRNEVRERLAAAVEQTANPDLLLLLEREFESRGER